VRNCVPAGWHEATIDDIAPYVQRGKSPKYADRSDLPVINQKCIRWDGVDPQWLKFIHPDQWDQWADERFLRAGDVLWNSTGTGTIGRASVFRGLADYDRAVADSHVTIVRCAEYLPKLLHYWIMSPFIQSKIEGMQSGSTNQVELSKKEVLATRVLVPPLPEQHRIVEAIESYLTRLDDAVASLERVRRNLERYRASVLKAAVEGRLVPTEAELARQEGRALPAPRPGTFYVYAIECEGGSHYIGQTDDIPRRWTEHVEGKGASWTKRHRPIRIIHWEEYGSREEAVEREKHLKTGFGRKWLKREIAAGRTRQAGYEPAEVLLERILAERKARWIEDSAEKVRAKGNAGALLEAKRKAEKKYKEPTVPRAADLPTLTKGWVWATLDCLSSYVTSGSRGWAKYYSDEGAAFLRIGDLSRSDLRPQVEKAQRVKLPDTAEGKRTSLQAGDILISITADLGIIGVMPADAGEAYVNQHIALVRPVDTDTSTYLSWYLASGTGQHELRRLDRGVTKAGLGLDDIRATLVPVPPLDEMKAIVSQIERSASVIAAQAQNSKAAQLRVARLRQSILKWAFEGKLVEQDPNDEPASVLLERIKTECETMPKPGRKTKTS